MTDAEIVGMLAEMLLEDSWQPRITQDEFPELLDECLRAYEYERRWNSNRPTGTTEWQEEAEIYAVASSAAIPVNRPRLWPASMLFEDRP